MEVLVLREVPAADVLAAVSRLGSVSAEWSHPKSTRLLATASKIDRTRVANIFLRGSDLDATPGMVCSLD